MSFHGLIKGYGELSKLIFQFIVLLSHLFDSTVYFHFIISKNFTRLINASLSILYSFESLGSGIVTKKQDL